MGFADLVRRQAQARGLTLPNTTHPEPLAALAYGDEQALKEAALEAFWKEAGLAGRPEPIQPAPLPRGYRTTSKRRAAIGHDGLALSFPGMSIAGDVAPSALDPAEHLAVYRALLPLLSRPSARGLAEELNWVVVRGNAGGLALLLNVRAFDASVVRGGKQIGDALRASDLGVASAFLYLDPSGSDYYLEARRPSGVLSQKRLYGPEWLQVRVGETKLRFPPTVFSQVNGAMLEPMVRAAETLAGPLAGRDLLDLYCGYGLFSLTIGRGAAHAIGVDHDGPAIEAAQENARHARGARARFVGGRITGEFLGTRVPAPRAPEVLLLDPPRQGTEAAVIEVLAERHPERVVHICCGTDEIPREVASWSRAGYRLERAVPMDLFAGTANLETLLLLTPA